MCRISSLTTNNTFFLVFCRMIDTKWEKSITRFRQTMRNESTKRRKIIEIDPPWLKSQAIVTEIRTDLPKLKIEDLIRPSQPRDVLKELVLELGIDKDDVDMVHREVAQEVLPKIQSIPAGRRARFRVESNYGAVEVFIRKSLNVWLIFEGEKRIFPKPRSDIAVEELVP